MNPSIGRKSMITLKSTSSSNLIKKRKENKDYYSWKKKKNLDLNIILRFNCLNQNLISKNKKNK